MATPGTYISGIAHTGLVIWLIAGWGFQSDPLPFEVSEVSIVSGEEFARMTAAATPDPVELAPEAPAAPVIEDQPEPVAPDDQVALAQPPAPVEPPAEETPPPEAPEPPTPVADVSDDAPVEPQPPVEPTPEILAPVIDDTPTPEAAPRVAPVPVEAPEPDAQIADEVQQSAEPDTPAPEVEPLEPVEETAPEEAATEIVTEAETPSGAVEVSQRPQVRPNRPAPVEAPAEDPTEDPEPATETAEALSEQGADVNAAVAAALAAVSPEGPPMNASEEEGFRVSVQNCWNVGSMSTAAQQVSVTVGFELGQDRKVVGNAVRLLGSSGGDSAAVDLAYATARRAILQCQNRGDGFDLPSLKYDHWKQIELTFDPSAMRLR